MPMTREDVENVHEEYQKLRKEIEKENLSWKTEVRGRFDALERGRVNSAKFDHGAMIEQAAQKRPAWGDFTAGKELLVIERKDIIGVSAVLPELYQPVAEIANLSVGGVRRLIPSTPTTAGAITFPRETGFTNAAAPVAEGAAKPKSDKTFAPAEVVVRTIAHYFKVSRQTYEDLPTVAAVINNNGVYGVEAKVEQQILKGTGTAPELQGIYPLATAAAAGATGDTLIDLWFKAVAQLGAAGYTPNGIVVSWADWTSTALLKDSTGRYLMGALPQLPPIVRTPYLSAGEWLVGDFARGAHIWERQTISVQAATQNEDDFVRNLVTLLAEERLALAVWQPSAFLKNGTGSVI